MPLTLVLVVSRFLLGLFLSSFIGFGLYILSLPMVLSLWTPEFINFFLLAITAIGFGASVGSFLAWFDRNYTLPIQALILLLVMFGAFLGAYLGLQRGIELAEVKKVFIPGVPTVSITAMGAVLGANLPMLAIAIYKAIRNPTL